MKLIQEVAEGDRFLEFVLTEREAKGLLSFHLVTGRAVVGNRLYHIGVRVDLTKGDEMPQKKGSSKKIIGMNVKEMEQSGHPPKQAVAAALHTAGVPKKIKKSKKPL